MTYFSSVHENASLSLGGRPSSSVARLLSGFGLCMGASEVIQNIARDERGRPRGYRLFRNWTRSLFSLELNPSPKQLL